MGKKAGSTTPVPLWKTSTTPPSMATPPLHHSQLPPKDKELSVSARKLAATLWEINDLPSADPVRGRDKAANFSSSRSGLLRPHMSDPSQSPLLEVNSCQVSLFFFWFIGFGMKLCVSLFGQRMKGFEVDGHKRRVSGLSHQLQSGDYLLEGLDSYSSARLIEVM